MNKKKYFIIVGILISTLICFSNNLPSQEEIQIVERQSYTFNFPPTLGFFSNFSYEFQTGNKRNEAKGIGGLILMGHEEQKLSWGIFCAPFFEDYSKGNIDGIFLGIVGITNKMTGSQLSFLNWTKSCTGGQIGIVANVSDSSYALQLATFCNATNNLAGIQLGLINSAGYIPQREESCKTNVACSSAGGQFGAFNMESNDTGCTVQLGLINIQKSSGVQIGVLNFSERGFLPFFPIINFSF